MAHCKYHPLLPATYRCKHCDISHCDQCAGEHNRHGEVVCHFCQRPVESLGTGASAEPFWRRLQQAFRYPLNGHALTVIVVVSLITTLLTVIPLVWFFTLIIYLALTGAMLKYSFRCLESTAAGEMSAPSVGDAYEGGLSILLKLISMMSIASILISLIAVYVSAALAGFLATVFIFSMPAVLIQFAHSEDIVEALNPINALRLITSIGLPYGLLIAFILIMMGSVGVINQLIGYRFSILSMTLQSVVSNYYMVVVFHIMGYMLFQYQEKLDFTARADDVEDNRDAIAIHLAKIDVHLKEGFYDKVVELFTEGIKKFPNDRQLAQNFFEFSLNTKRKMLMRESLDHYLPLLVTNREYDKMNVAYTTARQLDPELSPAAPEVRLQLAKISQAKGDATSAALLLNGLHKSHPQFPLLHEAFSLLATALDDLGKPAQAEKCRVMAKRLQKTPSKTKQVPADLFAAKELSYAPPEAKAEALPAVDAEPGKPKDLPPIEFK